MLADDLIWNYISECFDEHHYLPSWDEIAEYLDDKVKLDDFDLIDTVMKRFAGIHLLEGIEDKYGYSAKRVEEVS